MTLPLRLKAENIACERGGRLVFSNLSFTLSSGEMLELRGANGSGKSSLLRLLAGLNTPTTGSISLENGEPNASLAEQAHYIGHADANKPALTVAENLNFWTAFLGGTTAPLSRRRASARIGNGDGVVGIVRRTPHFCQQPKAVPFRKSPSVSK